MFARKWTLALFVVFFTVTVGVFAGGRKANESHEASNPTGFTETINIEEKKPGKWNIYLEAKDKGGNSTVNGPYNLYIDPESDLPITNIINPQPNMHVQGNLNIVGTAIDDDGVGYVDFVITRGDSGKGEVLLETHAEGKEFWSFFLDTSDTTIWKDGVYTVTAWATDIHGLSGISDQFPAKSHKKRSVVWNLDRKKPVIQVTSHVLGEIVNGKINVKGNVWDGNGIASLSYSADNGGRYQPVSLKYNKGDDTYSFDFPVETKTFEDGPAVILFKAKDGMGTEGALSFLVFANNSGPDVKILYPAPDAVVNGKFTVAGYAAHTVGLSSLTWKMGKDSGEIDLIVGNPWWSQEFDIRGQNVKSLDLEIKAVDRSGNTSYARRKLIVDQDLNLPKIQISEPKAGAVIPPEGLTIIGLAEDNQGVEAVFYSIDGKPALEISCSGYFQFVADDQLAVGMHTLDMWAIDITGVTGPKVSVKNLVAPGPMPEVYITTINTGSGKTAAAEQFYSGVAVNLAAAPSLVVQGSSPGGLQSISYQLGESAPVVAAKNIKAGDFTQAIALPKNTPLGFTRVEITITDIHGREASVVEYFHLVGADGQYVNSNDNFVWVGGSRAGEGGAIVFSTSDTMIGVYSGGPVESVDISGTGAASLSARADEYGRLLLTAGSEGRAGPVRFTINGSYRTPEFTFIADDEFPELEILKTPSNQWVQSRLEVTFRMKDNNKIKAVEFSTDMGVTWKPLLESDEIVRFETVNMPIDKVLDITSATNGAIAINIRVTDIADKSTVRSFQVHQDTIAPEATVVVPVSGAKVNGAIRLGMAIKEAGKLASIHYELPRKVNPDGSARAAISKQLYPDPAASQDSEDHPLTFYEALLDPTVMPLDKEMRFVFADEAGNKSVLGNWDFVIDPESDLPVLLLSLPLENEVITTDFVISGVCFDDDEIERLCWSLDGGYEQTMEVKNGFSMDIPLSSMTDNEHTLTIWAEDIYGVKGRPVNRKFRISLEEPKALIAYPSTGDIVGGPVRVNGVAMDENGIKRIQVSLDNGNTFNDADGTTRWTYIFNSTVIQDGNHAVFVRVWDNYDISAMYAFLISIDNTPPELGVNTPTDGAETTGPVYITGQVMDNMMLDSVTIIISSLDGAVMPPELKEKHAKLDALLLEHLDLSSLADGGYNIEIWAIDVAKNVTRVSRNVSLAKETQRNYIDTLYPLNGEYVQGQFNLFGKVGGIDTASEVTLVVNDHEVRAEPVSEAGYFRFTITAEDLVNGSNKMFIRSDFGGRENVESIVRTVYFQPSGPWVTVDSMTMGDFAYDRPWLVGRGGYELSDEDLAVLSDKKADPAVKAEIEGKKLSHVELSFDNGLTFTKADKSREKGSNWRYRLQTHEMKEGIHYMVIRAIMQNGEKAVTRLLVQVDKTAPVIRLITPQPGGRYNNEMEFAALANDDVELQSLTYHLRKGDMMFYAIPGFIKGLYIDATIPPIVRWMWNEAPTVFMGGATFFDVGLGLSFFDDNVKLQVSYGQMTQKQYEGLGGKNKIRYGGHVLGLKILANVYTLPFGSFGGPDWDWLAASLALGANFSLFDLAKEGYTQSGNSTWMSAMVAQLEFPRVTIPKRKTLRTFSFITEGQLWFVPTDVNASMVNVKTIIPHIVLGLRAYIF